VRLAKIEQLSEKRLAPPFAVPMALIIIIVIIIPALLEGEAAFVGALVGGAALERSALERSMILSSSPRSNQTPRHWEQ
jgi:hypothetical protein